MPNKPSAHTVTVSFTLPMVLAGEVDRLARRQMTNKSELIRRALMEFLPPETKKMVEDALAYHADETFESSMVAEVPDEKVKKTTKKKTTNKK